MVLRLWLFPLAGEVPARLAMRSSTMAAGAPVIRDGAISAMFVGGAWNIAKMTVRNDYVRVPEKPDVVVV